MQHKYVLKKGYKSIKLGLPFLHLEIPIDWRIEKLKNFVFDVRGGAPLEPKDFTNEGFPVLHKGDIKPNDVIKIEDTNPYCSITFAEKEKRSIIDKTFLVVTLRDLVPSGPNIGLIAHSQGTYLLAQGAYGFRYDTNKINSKYLVQLSNSDFYRRYMKGISVGSTQIHIRTPEFLNIILPIPSLKEQQKIASILSNVDELIQKTEQIIEQTQGLKKGLMQRLLTKGIGHSKYKKTGLGEIPEEWDIFKIEQIKSNSPNAITMGPFGSNITANNFVADGVPVIRGINLTKEPFNLSGFVFLTDEKADELKSANAFAGDIIFTHRGTLGQVGLIPNNTQYKRYVVSQSQMKLSCDLTKVEPLYVYYFFVSAQGQNALLSNVHGTGVPAIGQPTTTLKQIKIPIPSLLEQRKISNYLTLLNEMIEIKKKRKKVIEFLKKGLMQQLLTGKIRVKV